MTFPIPAGSSAHTWRIIQDLDMWLGSPPAPMFFRHVAPFKKGNPTYPSLPVIPYVRISVSVWTLSHFLRRTAFTGSKLTPHDKVVLVGGFWKTRVRGLTINMVRIYLLNIDICLLWWLETIKKIPQMVGEQ